MIELLTRTEYALKHELTQEAIRMACKVGTLSRVEFIWHKDGKEYKWKFILPKRYAIVDREKLMNASRSITSQD